MIRSILQLLVTVLLGLGLPPARAEEGTAPPVPGEVYVIPVEDMIEPALVYVMRRGVQEAERAHVKAIILQMNTLGGRLDAATEIVHLLQSVKVPTYTLVTKNAISAGAIIALATDHIYMAPGSVIGDAMPIMMSPMGGVQELPEDVQEKSVSAVSALIRAAAQESGHDPQLAEAMVRRELEYKIGDDVISPAGQLLTMTNVEAEREVGPPENRRKLLSSGTVADLDALLQTIGLSGASVRTLEVTSSERIARFIAALAPLLLMAGLLGLYIEFKTPGFGLPGILGLLALALFFWGHHIAGLAGLEDVLIFLLGLILVLVEVFVLPGFGIPGVLGLLLMLWALLDAMAQKLPGGPWYPTLPDLQGPLAKLSLAIVMTGLAALAVGRYLPRTPMFNWLVLKKATSSSAGYSAAPAASGLLGQEGTALTALRPGGAVQLGEVRCDVVSRGGFIEQGQRVRVAEVHGNRIVVEPASAAPPAKG